MSAIHPGRQRPSLEGEELYSLYTMQVEAADANEGRLPGAPPSDDRSPYDGPISAPGYAQPLRQPSVAASNRQTAVPRSRPLPAVPGAQQPSRPGVSVSTSQPYAYQDPSRPSPTSQQAMYENNYNPQTVQSTHRISPSSATRITPSPYQYHKSSDSDFSGSNASHGIYHGYVDQQYPHDGKNRYPIRLDEEKAHSPDSTPQPYLHGGITPLIISDTSRKAPNEYLPHELRHPSESLGGSKYSSSPESHRMETHQNEMPPIISNSNNYPYSNSGGDRYRAPYSTGPNAHPSTMSAQIDLDDDIGAGVGALLLRSTSDSSSLNSSLLQEPRHSPTTLDSGLFTPTTTTRNPLAYMNAAPSSRPQTATPRDYQSPVSGYPTILMTPADTTPSSSRRSRRHEYQRIEALKGPLELHEDEEEEEEDEEDRFVNLALLSHLANRMRDRVPRGLHVKGSIPYPRAFTGKDIVSTIQTQIQKEFQNNMGFQTSDRRAALQVARSLQSQLFFYEVEWGGRQLQDGVEDVYMFLDEGDAIGGDGPNEQYRLEREELPTGVITLLTKCYSPSCQEGSLCYSYLCPRRSSASTLEMQLERNMPPPDPAPETPWGEIVDRDILRSLPEAEIRRQTIISKVIMKEQQYLQDLDFIETIYIKGLRLARPPVIPVDELDDFIQEVFGNISDLRQCNRRLLDVMFVRQREQAPIIQRIGDIFLQAAAEFRTVYPIYVGNLPVAEKRIKEEVETNAEFRRFLEQCARQDTRRLDLRHFITRPAEHLQKYPVLLEAIFKETAEGNPDADFLVEAEQAIRNLSTVAQLRTFQSAMGRGPTGKLEWHDLVPKDIRSGVTKQETKRQSIIWELIKTEMVYVKDLETIETLFIRPLRNANIIPRDRLPAFLHDVFHNFAEIHGHHRRMLDRLHEIQRDEHPFIRTITAPVFDAALNWRDAYMEYIPHYPIAAFRIDDEMANNQSFKAFIDQCIRHPDSRKLDLKAFINRPIPRLLRYELLLKGIMEASPPIHEDRETIPQVLEVIKDLGKATEPGVQSAKQKVELWRYHANLIFKPGEMVDMDLLDETRTLIHAGKLLRQPEGGFDLAGWSEMFVLLFDNYFVMTKPRERDGVTRYHVNKRPIPLDLLSLLSFNDPPTQRATGLLRPRARTIQASEMTLAAPGMSSGDSSNDSRSVYPLQLHHNGRTGGIHTLFTETIQQRQEWKSKLEEALGLRKVVQESNKVFEIETLSLDTFLVPSIHHSATTPSWNEEGMFTGKVTCSVPFTTSDGRGLVAIGCAEGVWIGLRHDSKSMRRVLHLKLVTQCAMLEDFGIFLVLADKSLFAYHIEALVPSNPPSPHATRTPQKLNGNKDVQFFSVGNLSGRTVIIYMKKKGMDSIFRVLEPVVERINEKTRTAGGFGRFAFGTNRSEWFRVYRDFFLPSEAYDLVFLKAKIAILCSRGFEIMELTDFKSVTIPQREDPRLVSWSKRLESCKPLGMFRSSENEFLLCYDEFGMYVDRHGDPSRTVVTVEWEGTAERVACHPPYILLFDPRFIEIRHIETGRLAQIIPGHDVRCLWDGRGASIPPILTPGPDGWQEGGAQDARVHATMKAEESTVGANGTTRSGTRAVGQHVFELLPTIPLYLPGSLASPSQSTYFAQSNSPPHSPRLNPAWRQ